MSVFEILFSAEALAASTAGGEGHATSVTQLIFPLVNFLIFLYLIKRFLVPFLRDHLRSRREDILTALKEADEGREQAEAMAREYRERLGRLDEEAREIREALRAEGEREKAKLLSEAEEIAVKTRADADFIAEQEIKMARALVREEMARMARAAAERVVQSHLTSADQRRLVEDFMHRVEQVG